MIFTAYGLATDANTLRFSIYDGTDTTNSSYHTGGGAWEKLTVTHTFNAGATECTAILEFNQAIAGDRHAYVDGAMTISSLSSAGAHWCNFNGETYFSAGQCLMKINSSGTLLFVRDMGATITSLTASIGNDLYIFVGDAAKYWFLTTAGVFAQNDTEMSTKSVHWDTKLMMADSAGNSYTSTAPNDTTSPVWTAAGDLADEGLADNDLERLLTYRDANGNVIIYATTKQGLFAHDFANALWTETELSLPNHPTGGKGAVVWRDGLYISAGLDVIKYTAASVASIEYVGLNKDDGMPAEYRGEIVSLIPGYTSMFALVDSSLVTGTGYSGIYEYDGIGWQCAYLSGSADKVMYGGIVSSVYGYKLWFGYNGLIYSMNIERDVRNPLKNSAYTYHGTSTHITPWFDGGWASSNKVALKLKVSTGNLGTSDVVVVYYRTDHSDLTIASGWTTLGTISTNTETTYSFGTGNVGVEFKNIQFKYALQRNAGVTTQTPDVYWASLAYYIKPEPLITTGGGWAYNFAVDCTKTYAKNAPSELIDALRTAAETKTMIQIAYRNDVGGTETYLGNITDVKGSVESGQLKRGQYAVRFLVP